MIIQVKDWAQKTRTTLQPQSPCADWAFHIAAIWLLFYFCDTSRVLIDYQKNVFRSRVLSMVFSSCNTSRARSTFHPPKSNKLFKNVALARVFVCDHCGAIPFFKKNRIISLEVSSFVFSCHTSPAKSMLFLILLYVSWNTRNSPPHFSLCATMRFQKYR